MKRSICFMIVAIGALYFFPLKSYGQRRLITAAISSSELKQKETISSKVLQIIEKKSKTGSVSIFRFNSEILRDSIFIFDVFPNQPLKVTKDEMDKRSNNDFSIYAHIGEANNKEGSLVLTYLNGEVSGNLNYKFKNYAIHPLGKERFAIYEIEFKSFPPEDAPSKQKNDAGSSSNPGLSAASANATTADAPACRIRVLVAFTPDAENQIKNTLGYSTMNQFINQAIAETNQSYLNSNVNFRVELANAIRVSYTESGNYDTDLGRFRDNGDGYMDEVHTYRDLYSADICVMIFNNGAYCGLASAIQANAATAFSVVHYGCVLGYYSFGHEMGHLYGCRHNPETDNTSTPFAYGHGYVYTPGSWRTIMAYNLNGETRLQYYSNPNVTYNGVAMGNTDVSYNARVLNEQAGAVGGFRSTPSDLVLTSANSIINDETGDAIATTSVVLQPGFQATNNAAFHAYIKSCTDVADANRYTTTAKPGGAKSDNASTTGKSSLSIFPNPSSGTVQILVEGASLNHAEIVVSDQFGREVYKTSNQSGRNISFDLSRVSNGLYYIKIKQGDNTIVKKVVILR